MGSPARGSGAILTVQDACQAHGIAATFRSPAAYSFYPTKNLPCLGDGGAVLTDSPRPSMRNSAASAMAVAATTRSPRSRRQLPPRRDAGVLPARVRAEAERMECTIGARLAARYDKALADCERVRPVGRREGSVCHLYVVRVKRREKFRKFLADAGIATGVHYPVPLHKQPAFREFAGRRPLPVAERACREIVSLPLWP